MNWTVYSKISGEVLSHRDWPRGADMHLPDNQAATPGHVNFDMVIFNGKPYSKIGPEPKPHSDLVVGQDLSNGIFSIRARTE